MKLQTLKSGNNTLHFKGVLYSDDTLEDIFQILAGINESELSEILNKLKGHFAFIFHSESKTICATDKVRSIPIFFTNHQGFNASFKADELTKKSFQLDKSQLRIFKNAGYTFGNNTLLKELFVLSAGEYLYKERSQDLSKQKYYRHLPDLNFKEERTAKDLKEELGKVLLNIFRDVIKIANGRQIVVPLSAGYDSRLVVSALRKLDYKNVKTFSYGMKDNFESKSAQEIAHELGYEWRFFESNKKSLRQYFKSQAHKDFLNFSNDYCATPFEQDIAIIKQIKESHWVNDDSIFINGNSGDFISGGHILDNSNAKPLIDQYLEKHCKLWDQFFFRDESLPFAKEQIEEEISPKLKESYDLALILEDHELSNRQAKYVVNGQRGYEFYDYDWLLPLWHDDLMEFFRNVPIDHKYKQSLYKEFLHESNWGNVWDFIPVNKLEIRPKWISPLRFVAKIICAPFGKGFWHKIEKKVFYYFMDLSCNISVISYWKSLFSLKIARNFVSWHSYKYLEAIKEKW